MVTAVYPLLPGPIFSGHKPLGFVAVAITID